jgi:hypothetical protein
METVEGQIIEEKDIIDVIPETPKQQPGQSECNTCKQKGLSKGQTIMLIVSFYILFTSIYGTIKIIKEIINYIP